MLQRKLVYIQVHKGYFFARIVGETSDVRYECPGLDHPRTLAGDFESIVSAFQVAFKDLLSVSMRLLKPKILIHLVPIEEGGVTPIELRAFREAAVQSGKAGAVFLSAGEEYGPANDDQLRELL